MSNIHITHRPVYAKTRSMYAYQSFLSYFLVTVYCSYNNKARRINILDGNAIFVFQVNFYTSKNFLSRRPLNPDELRREREVFLGLRPRPAR